MSALAGTIENFLTHYGYLAIFVLMAAESACIPIPSEVTMMVGGWYSADGRLEFFWVGIAGVAGNLVGSWAAYALGRATGRDLLDRYGRYVLIRSHDVDRAEAWWDRHGEAATFFGRLLPVIRTFISLPAGIAEMPFGRFTLYTLLGVIPWTVALAWAGSLVGANYETVSRYFNGPTLAVLGALIVGAVVWVVARRRERASSPPTGDEPGTKP